MKNRAPKFLTLFLFLICVSPMFAQSNDEIISDEALESWLNEYSKLKSDSSGLVATVDTVINSIVVIEPDSTLIVE